MDAKRVFKTPLFWVLAVIAITVVMFSLGGDGGYATIDTAKAEKLITDKKVDKAELTSDNVLKLDLKKDAAYSDKSANIVDADKVQAEYVDARAESLITLIAANEPTNGYNDKRETQNPFFTILISIFPILLLVGLFWFMMSQAQGGGSRVMQFGKSKAKLATKDTPKVTFDDVAGADEAVQELYEIKEFLSDPAKFLAVGAKIPKGVLLYGPPGTG
ncbi:MAG: ATP-dependent metallopeptidase FtsH/Yme1/Tma family protein, partial [Knoellia sp.]